MRRLTAFIAAILLISTFSLRSQSVGVVMSGGGAKGLYHIGILQALEENGIPIDYVAGTSMGSIIAGLYAAGYSPQEMRDIVTSGEVETWLTGKINSNYGAFYRQYRSVPAMVNIRLGSTIESLFGVRSDTSTPDQSSLQPTDTKPTERLEDDLKSLYNHETQKPRSRPSLYMPKSLIPSTQIDMALNELFAPASIKSGGDFSRLMVPFLCVASDKRNHKEVILTVGDLGHAIRASMAIPIAFEPVIMGDAVLFDGGIYDNFPWKPMVDSYSPDVIIGGICTAGNTQLNDNSSLVDQVFALTTNESNYDLPEGSVTIQRDIAAGMLDFTDGEWIIDMGYNDTMEQMDSIKLRIAQRRDEGYYDERRAAFKADIKPLIFDKYQITGLSSEQSRYVRDFLNTSRDDWASLQREMSYEELKENLYSILSSGDFSSQYPRISYDPESEKYGFKIGLDTKPSLKLSLGGHLSSTVFNQLYLSLNYQNIGRVAQSFYTDLYLGPIYTSGTIGGRTDFYVKRPLFVEYYYTFSVKNQQYSNFGNVTDVTNTEQIENNENYLSVASGFPISQRSMFSLRFNSGWSNYYYSSNSILSSATDLNTSTDNLYERTRLGFAGIKAEYQRSTLNRKAFAQRGSRLIASAIGVYGSERNYSEDYSRVMETPATSHWWHGAKISYEKYFNPPSDNWFSVGVRGDGVYTDINQFGNPTAEMLILPSYQPINLMKMIYMPDFSARSFIAAGVMPTIEFAPDFMLRMGFYSMLRNRYDIGGVDPGVIDSKPLHYISDAAFVYYSPIGPVSLSVTKFDLDSWDNMYITFNFGFAMFSPKGTFY